MFSKKILIKILSVLPYAFMGIVLFLALSFLDLFSFLTNIIMYKGIMNATLTFIIQVLFITKHKDLDLKLSACYLAIAFNISFLVIFPVTIDRSVSVYLLSKIEENVDGIKEKDLEKFLIEEYVVKFSAVERRVKEQKINRIIESRKNKLHLTKIGRNFLSFCKLTSKVFHTDKRFIYNK